jgi:FlaA1/EpsC-like NDP-sugar epimerase
VLDALYRKSVLITGAGGSIGSALALRLAALAPSMLVLLESSESHLYALQREWAEAGVAAPAACYLGSVDDRKLLDHIFATHNPGLVYHAAAFKHVPLMEQQPLAAIANNVFGTRTLVEAVAAHGVRVVQLSTDKAVEPTSVMGATKRAAEHIVLAAGGTVLRLGNVLASRDSVVEVFARQIGAGGPITVTDPAARRYFLTLDEAVNLLLIAAAEPEPPVLLTPALPAPHYIADLAQYMARKLAPNRTISIDFTHPRPGDKETERLWSATETARPAHDRGLLMVQSPVLPDGQLQTELTALRSALDVRDLPAALAQLRIMVPDYTPSQAVLVEVHGPRVSQ